MTKKELRKMIKEVINELEDVSSIEKSHETDKNPFAKTFGKNLATDRQKKNGTEVYKINGQRYTITGNPKTGFYAREIDKMHSTLPIKAPSKNLGANKKTNPKAIHKTKMDAYRVLDNYLKKKKV